MFSQVSSFSRSILQCLQAVFCTCSSVTIIWMEYCPQSFVSPIYVHQNYQTEYICTTFYFFILIIFHCRKLKFIEFSFAKVMILLPYIKVNLPLGQDVTDMGNLSLFQAEKLFLFLYFQKDALINCKVNLIRVGVLGDWFFYVRKQRNI